MATNALAAPTDGAAKDDATTDDVATDDGAAPLVLAAAGRIGTWRQTGLASWYGGKRWHGRPTASGELFDENSLTAAHATLPLGSRVRVTVADTGRSVIVTINDRPGTRRRIIDLSRAAARELGIIRRGIAPVIIAPPRPGGMLTAGR